MNTSLYVVRHYRPSDFDDYARLNIEAERVDPIGCASSLLALSENLGRPNYSPERNIFVAEIAGKIVGLVSMTPELKSRRVILDCLVLHLSIHESHLPLQ